MKSSIIFFLLSCISAFAQASAPDLFSVKIGEVFPEKTQFENSDPKPRPTIQFKVPNTSKSSALFSEYEVVIVRSLGKISIVTGSRAFETMEACQAGKGQAHRLVSEEYPKHIYAPQEFKYELQSSNIYIRLACSYRSEGPYPILELQFRGKKEDQTLKQDWEKYFQSQR